MGVSKPLRNGTKTVMRPPNADQLSVSVVHCVVHSMVRSSSSLPQPIDAGVRRTLVIRDLSHYGSGRGLQGLPETSSPGANFAADRSLFKPVEVSHILPTVRRPQVPRL